MKKITYKDYYLVPSIEHYTGDIWNNLPSFGLLKTKFCSGLIITPACDLANSKVETITYLPIISIDEFFVSRLFYPIIRSVIVNLANNIKDSSIVDYLSKNVLPNSAEIVFLKTECQEILKKEKNNASLGRIIIGLDLIQDIINLDITQSNSTKLRTFFSEKELNRIKVGLVKNSFSSDLHFTPHDMQDSEWSAIRAHSVILFRYPATAPIEIFENASDSNCLDWDAKMKELSQMFSMAAHFKDAKPLKTCRLNEKFLSDILTRFVSLYIRIGSPDFDDETIKKMTEEI